MQNPLVASGKSSAVKFYENKYKNGAEVPKSSKSYAVDLLSQGSALKVLDLGCGTGGNSQLIASRGHSVKGIDISEAAISKYQENGFDGLVCDIETSSIPQKFGIFDAVYCSEVLEHLLDPLAALKKMNSCLKEDGTLILTVPNSSWWLYRLAALIGKPVSELQHPMHFQFFSARRLIKLVRDAGFSHLTLSGRNMYLVFPDLWRRLLSTLMPRFAWQYERRFTTGKNFWHLSSYSQWGNALFADTLILKAKKA